MATPTALSDDDPRFLARDSPDRPHVLIAFDSTHDPHMLRLAKLIAGRFEAEGFIAELADASAHGMPVPPDYDLIVIGMTFHRVDDHAILRWLEDFGFGLREVPSAAFVVASNTHWPHTLSRISHHLGWRPLLAAAFPPLALFASHRFARQLVADQRSVTTFVQRVVSRLRHETGDVLAPAFVR